MIIIGTLQISKLLGKELSGLSCFSPNYGQQDPDPMQLLDPQLTHRKQATQRGLGLDECYCLGELREVPDIAIEIVITTRLLDRLEIDRSQLLPQLDPDVMIPFLQETNQTQAVRAYRARLRQP